MTGAGPTTRVTRGLARVWRCASAEPRLFIRALGWRLVLPWLKVMIPIGRLAPWIRREASVAAADRPARVAAIDRLAREGGRLVIPSNCLERSLLLYRLLSEAGAEPSLVVGVRRTTGVEAHAWIERGGAEQAATDDPEQTPYLAIARWPA